MPSDGGGYAGYIPPKPNFEVGPPVADFVNEVQKIMVQQPDYSGVGAHGVKDHGGHGPHSQISIGMGNQTVNFRYPAP